MDREGASSLPRRLSTIYTPSLLTLPFQPLLYVETHGYIRHRRGRRVVNRSKPLGPAALMRFSRSKPAGPD